YAAIKFFIYTLLGSVFMLLIIVGLYFSVQNPYTGGHTFNMLYMMNSENYVPGSFFDWVGNYYQVFGIPARMIGSIDLYMVFAIWMPVVPLPTWLPDAHVEAPTPVSMILARILLKIGVYGSIRICIGIFPDSMAAAKWWLRLIGIVSSIYGALNAL